MNERSLNGRDALKVLRCALARKTSSRIERRTNRTKTGGQLEPLRGLHRCAIDMSEALMLVYKTLLQKEMTLSVVTAEGSAII